MNTVLGETSEKFWMIGVDDRSYQGGMEQCLAMGAILF